MLLGVQVSGSIFPTKLQKKKQIPLRVVRAASASPRINDAPRRPIVPKSHKVFATFLSEIELFWVEALLSV